VSDSFQALLATLAAGTPAGRVHSDGQTLSFRDLASAAQQEALALAPLRQQRVALHAEPSLRFLITLLACWQAEALPVLLDRFSAPPAGVRAQWQAGQWQPEAATGPVAQPPGLVLLTSGSSGEPKGVQLAEARILSHVQAVARAQDLQEPAAVAVMLPLHHAFALITQVLLTLYHGGELHFLPADALPAHRLAYLSAQRIERLAGVPTQFRLLLPGLASTALTHLTVAGAALDQASAEALLAACPQAALWVGYGLSEAGPRVSAIRHDHPQFWQGSVGPALPGCQLRCVAGEIQVRSPWLMTGYLDQPPLPADHWLPTGDTGWLADDCLWVSGRRDELFQVGGEKVAPLEIEQVLLACPGVTAAAVYGLPDPLLGASVCALVQGEVALAALQRAVRTALPPGKRPQQWFRVTALPLTGNGKLRRGALAEWPRQAFEVW
jgi:acyl-CoA synthetase (AMP-forming)/AMP-acid ligase II